MQVRTASITDGSRPPRELRTVAILFTLTDSLGKMLLHDAGESRSAHRLISASSLPSSMIRSSGSVPE